LTRLLPFSGAAYLGWTPTTPRSRGSTAISNGPSRCPAGGSGLEIAAACLALALGGGIEVLALAWVAAMTVQGAILWPVIAVAGDLPGRPRANAPRWMRWVAPRTMSRSAHR